MAKRIRLRGTAEMPLGALGGYVLSGSLLCTGGAQEFGTTLRGPLMISAVIAFLAGVAAQILDKIDQHNEAMLGKIDASVGDVYDTGKRAGKREQDLLPPEPRLAVVRDGAPRR